MLWTKCDFIHWWNSYDYWCRLGSTMDASNLIKPALANGTALVQRLSKNIVRYLKRIISSFPKNWRKRTKHFWNYLRGLKTKFEDFHHVQYDDWFLRLSFLRNLLMIVSCRNWCHWWSRCSASLKSRKSLITVENIEDIVSKIARIRPCLKMINQYLKILSGTCCLWSRRSNHCFGFCNQVAGLKSPDKPVGSFVFAGPLVKLRLRSN